MCWMVRFTICCTTVVVNMQWMIKRVGMIEFQGSFKDHSVWTAVSLGDPSNYSSKRGKVSAI
jgi:hypothetical protein